MFYAVAGNDSSPLPIRTSKAGENEFTAEGESVAANPYGIAITGFKPGTGHYPVKVGYPVMALVGNKNR
jgi:hypothetical protein